MWARVVEVMLGVWLLISPFVFGYQSQAFWINDYVTAAFIFLFSLSSFWKPWRYAHLLNIAIGIWLIAYGYIGAPYPPPPNLQSNVFIGWLLLIFSIIPNRAQEPSESWVKFLQKKQEGESSGVFQLKRPL